MATTLPQAFQRLHDDRALARRFSENPEEVLQEMGVDTSRVQITKSAAGEQAVMAADASICGSVGCVVCATVGS
jgi:hypothetical protein